MRHDTTFRGSGPREDPIPRRRGIAGFRTGPFSPRRTPGPDALLTGVVAVIAFIVPFDGFYDLSRIVGASPVTLASYVAAFLLISRVPRIFATQSPALWCFAGAFALGTALTMYFSLSGGPSALAPLTAWQLLGLLALITAAAASDAGYPAVRLAALSGLVATCIAYLVLYRLEINVSQSIDRVNSVAGYQTNQAGEAAALTLILLMGAVLTGWRNASIKARMLYVPVTIAALSVLVMTNSRGATLMFIVGLVPFALLPVTAREPQPLPTTRWGTRPARRRTRPLLFLGIVAAAAVALLGSEGRAGLIERISQRWVGPQSLDELTTGRSEIMASALDISREFPMGVGLGGSGRILAQRSELIIESMAESGQLNAHNEFLRVLLECGWAGLALFLSGWVFLFLRAWRIFLRHRNPELLAIMLALSVSFNTGTAASVKLSWVLLGLVAAAALRSRDSIPAAHLRATVPGSFRARRSGAPTVPRGLRTT